MLVPGLVRLGAVLQLVGTDPSISQIQPTLLSGQAPISGYSSAPVQSAYGFVPGKKNSVESFPPVTASLSAHLILFSLHLHSIPCLTPEPLPGRSYHLDSDAQVSPPELTYSSFEGKSLAFLLSIPHLFPTQWLLIAATGHTVMGWRWSDGKLRLKTGELGPGAGPEMAAEDSPAIPALLPASPAVLPSEQMGSEGKTIPPLPPLAPRQAVNKCTE